MRIKLLYVLFLVSSYAFAQNWSQVGSAQFTNLSSDAAMTFDAANGDIYVAYSNVADGNKAYVSKFDGTNWMSIGLVSNDAADNIAIKINPFNNEIVVAYRNVTNNMTAYKYNGTVWSSIFTNVGSSALSDHRLQIQFNAVGTIRVAGREWTQKLFIVERNTAGTGPNHLEVLLNPNNQYNGDHRYDFTAYDEYFVSQENNYNGSVTGRKNVGSANNNFDFNNFLNGTTTKNISGIYDSNYHAFYNDIIPQGAANNDIRVYNGSSFIKSVTATNDNVELRKSSNDDKLYLMYANNTEDIVFENYDTSLNTWTTLPSVGLNYNSSNFFIKMAISEADGNLYVLYQDNDKVSLKKYTITTTACNVNIPDANFKAALLGFSYINTNGDSEISCTEASAYTGTINVQNLSISDLTGIEAFTNITELYCKSNSLTSLNVSANIALTNLECRLNQITSLDVSNNTALERLSIDNNSIASLDISNNTALIYLYCYSNQLTSLDVSNNTTLEVLQCGNNQLTSLDVNGTTALRWLQCEDNQLTNLDVSSNTALTTLYCHSNLLTSLDVSFNTALTNLNCQDNQLTSLDVSSNTALTNLNCQYNQLTSLDVSGATALTYLNCQDNQLMSLDVSANTVLTNLSCYSNQLTSLDVSGATALNSLYCYDNQLTSLDISSNTVIDELYCDDNQLTSLNAANGNNNNLIFFSATNNPSLTCIQVDDVAWSTTNWTNIDATASFNTNCICYVNIPDANFKAALLGFSYINTNGDSEISCTEASAYTGSIYVPNLSISDLTGIEAFTNITELWCGSNSLSSLNVSANTALTNLNCYGNQLTNLDVSANTALAQLRCGNNQLTSIDVSANTALEEFFCDNNQLTNLDVSSNTVLTTLYCLNNQLTNLDVSSNTALTTLYCYDNQLTSLDVSNNTTLEVLLCANNQLTSLDVSGTTALINLNCRNNLLMSLDVPVNTALTTLRCDSNQLTSLDVSSNTALISLYCEVNQLTSLDVSSNTALISLYCFNNQLTSIDISSNTAIVELFCSDNQLTSLNAANGNNNNINSFSVTNNPSLTCIQVDDASYSTTNWTNIDTSASFSTNCAALSSIDFEKEKISIYPNPTKSTLNIKTATATAIANISVYSLLGKQVIKTNSKTVDVSSLSEGVYLIKIIDLYGNQHVKRFIKE
ncbi:T9SS type A sorting domain-containing protein [Winogradskyella sp. Asnod2-B02-A]|uniref:T9SS type A sorting domain-containing protein n=1 Tax=Winogradskyella sp. Asnod2-B02-A TaxID=3160583 RepID=UPI003864E55B